MVFRSAALFLLVLCASAFSQTPDQTPDQSNPRIPKSFHDPVLNITYFYPGRFVPAAPAPLKKSDPATPQCAQSTLSASSATPSGTSVFVLSSIDSACPNILHGAATDLGAFTREQVLRQLKHSGTAVITQEPTHYTIDGHPAVVTLASATPAPSTDLNNIAPTKITYAAKACVLGSIPVKPRRRSDPVDPVRHVLCFDYTTQERDLLSLLFAFTVQFDDHGPQPLIPGSAIR